MLIVGGFICSAIAFPSARSWMASWPWWLWPVVIFALLMLGIAIGNRLEKSAVQQRQLQRQLEYEKEDKRAAEKKEQEEKEWQKYLNEVRQKESQENDLMESVYYMDGHTFEFFMADLFRKQGYSVQVTPGSGDHGIDLLLDLDGRKIAIQLKRWKLPVGDTVVYETRNGMLYYWAQEAWIITTSSFTKGAKAMAKSYRVRLIDGDELANWMRIRSAQQVSMPPVKEDEERQEQPDAPAPDVGEWEVHERVDWHDEKGNVLMSHYGRRGPRFTEMVYAHMWARDHVQGEYVLRRKEDA